MGVILIICKVLLVVTSLLLILTVLMHKGRGGGLSDMFGGGFSSAVASSGVAERNLHRITVGISVIWVLTIVVIGVITKIQS